MIHADPPFSQCSFKFLHSKIVISLIYHDPRILHTSKYMHKSAYIIDYINLLIK